jgi:hypothetical protein
LTGSTGGQAQTFSSSGSAMAHAPSVVGAVMALGLALAVMA